MLFGTASHSHDGLMRAVWASSELRRGVPSDWAFSDREGVELRGRLLARIRPSDNPAALVASIVDDGSLPDDMKAH
jgi:hypothetical protein